MTEFKKIIYMDTDTIVLKVNASASEPLLTHTIVLHPQCRTSTTLLRNRRLRPHSRILVVT